MQLLSEPAHQLSEPGRPYPGIPGRRHLPHGNCVTLGCIPITDDGIKEVYWLAVLARTSGQNEMPIEIFPARPTGAGVDRLAPLYRDRPELPAFSENLKERFDDFEKRRGPRVGMDRERALHFRRELSPALSRSATMTA